MHDIFLIITKSIRNGELREPERLMGYVRTIVRRQVAAHINSMVQARRNQTDLDFGTALTDYHPNPERRIIEEQNLKLAMRILGSLHKREREVLIRFYLREQTPGEICRDMDLTETQFRLIKSRAKARFGELGRRRLALRAGMPVVISQNKYESTSTSIALYPRVSRMIHQGRCQVMAFNTNRHMDEDEIEKYSMGAVSEEECARFDEHLLICEFCRNRVTKSDDYVVAMQGAGLHLRRQHWKPEANRRRFPRLSPFFYTLGLAAAVVLVALVALGGLRPWARETAPAFAVNLEATRGAGIEAQAPAGRALLLNLDLAGLPAQPSYRVEAVDRLGRVVWQGTVPSQDSKASAWLPGMPAGVYFVRVYAVPGNCCANTGSTCKVSPA